ncbi:MAG: GDSL-type esterase/lipase family protein [Bacilli bacterium]|jgi:lysophospholipase L1-like esterase
MIDDVLFIVNLILLTTNLTIAVLLFFMIKNLMKKRINEKIRQYDDFNAIAKKNGIVFFGDSLTEFYYVHEFFHDKHVYNRGIASDTTSGVLNRLRSNVISLAPRKVFLQIGTNDFHKRRAVEYIFSKIKRIIEVLKEHLPETKIYLISLYPVNPKIKVFGKIVTYPRKNKNIDRVNLLLEKYAEESNITYIDINSKLKNDKGLLKPEYTLDGLHLTHDGYQLVTDILKIYIDD